jgi:hypothetical protein
MNPCCDTPSITRNHLAFPWKDGYNCLGGLFPVDHCSCCGEDRAAFGTLKEWLFYACGLIFGTWDGAICTGHPAD